MKFMHALVLELSWGQETLIKLQKQSEELKMFYQLSNKMPGLRDGRELPKLKPIESSNFKNTALLKDLLRLAMHCFLFWLKRASNLPQDLIL